MDLDAGNNWTEADTMTEKTLDPKTALIVIDLQKGLLNYPTIQPIAEVLAHAGELANAFCQAKPPVVSVTVRGAAHGRAEQSDDGI